MTGSPESGVRIRIPASCPYPGYRCTASDMNYLIVAPDRIPWGHLNEIDMGAGGYRMVTPDTQPLECADIHDGDQLEFDGRAIYRTGKVRRNRNICPRWTRTPSTSRASSSPTSRFGPATQVAWCSSMEFHPVSHPDALASPAWLHTARFGYGGVGRDPMR